MHEIVYLQVGNLPNFIGTHFWNAQDAYSEEEIAQEISWSMRSSTQNERNDTVLRPRVLLFDTRQNLGTLQSISAVSNYEPTEEDTETILTWDGSTQESREPEIQRSRYLSQLEQTEEENDEKLYPPESKYTRFWSDFNHVYFSPDSIHSVFPFSQRLEDGQEGDETAWAVGLELFERYNKENDLMDTSVRRFTEECDSLQAFQGLYDPLSFGGFGISLLQCIADEYPKVTKVDFTLLGEYNNILVNQASLSKANALCVLSNALSFFHLGQLSDLSVPLLPQTMWAAGTWSDLLPGLEANRYHESSIYAAHIENVSWPVRALNKRWDSIVNVLNQGMKTKFSCLTGVMPASDERAWMHRLELTKSKMTRRPEDQLVALYQVSRGLLPDTTLEVPLTPLALRKEEIKASNTYPIPLSHPQYFMQSTPNTRVNSIPIYSALTTQSAYGEVFRCHAQWLRRYVRLGGDPAIQEFDRDELMEVVEGLDTIAEAYAGFEKENDDLQKL